MLVQTKIATIEVNEKKGKRHRPDVPSYRKTDKIKDFIKEWNTIENIELYEPLYKLCSQLCMLKLMILGTCHYKNAITNIKTY